MTQSARMKRNYTSCFEFLQLFKQNISHNDAGCGHISTDQTVRATVQFIMGVTLFTAEQDPPEALYTPHLLHLQFIILYSDSESLVDFFH